MKTSQNMLRKMGDFEVTQRTKDGMFNATLLLKQWNSKATVQKKMDNYFNLNGSEEFVQEIMDIENLNTPKLVYLKSRGKYNGGTWMHPLLFVDFAMWLNPKFKYHVLKFVSDEMIKYRNKAGDGYKDLSSSVSKLVSKKEMPKSMTRLSQALNHVVFGNHKTGIRNEHGSEEKQDELYHLETKVSDLIREGFITSFDDVINYLRKLYQKKYTPKVLNLCQTN